MDKDKCKVEDLDFALKVCTVIAPAFLPEDSIDITVICFQQICEIMPEEFGEFYEYFAKIYVGRCKVRKPGEVIPLGWKDDKYPPSNWPVCPC